MKTFLLNLDINFLIHLFTFPSSSPSSSSCFGANFTTSLLLEMTFSSHIKLVHLHQIQIFHFHLGFFLIPSPNSPISFNDSDLPYPNWAFLHFNTIPLRSEVELPPLNWTPYLSRFFGLIFYFGPKNPNPNLFRLNLTTHLPLLIIM